MLSVKRDITIKASSAATAKEAFTCKTIVFLLLSFIILSCSSSVRFAEKKQDTNSKSKSTRPLPKPFPKTEYERELSTAGSIRRKIVEEAHDWIGTPYLWGGDTRRGVDCSGFVKNVLREVRINVSRTAAEQYSEAKKIQPEQKLPGDLIFFTNGVGISHVGIYIGAGYLIHASTSSGVIRQSIDDTYLKEKFVSFGRINLD